MSFVHFTSVNLNLPIGRRSLGALLKPVPRLKDSSRIETNEHGRLCKVLQNISLEIHSGEKVGVIGVNGAGKSSLLRLLAGIYAPTSGSISTEGKVSTLFAATVGMNENASGRENIFLSARTLGMSRAQINAVSEEIIEFAELGEFIELPLRVYSAGMKMRLGFAVATALEPEILLIDEVFGAGDTAFRKRADQRLQKVMDRAGLIVMATHSEAVIRNFCDRVIWLHQGQIRFDGPTQEGLQEFKAVPAKGKTS